MHHGLHRRRSEGCLVFASFVLLRGLLPMCPCLLGNRPCLLGTRGGSVSL
jgi:hypothetical protein